MATVAPQNQHELAGNEVGLVHRVAQSPLGDLWLALDRRGGPPGEPVLLRYVTLAGGATRDTLERVIAAAHAATSLSNGLLLPVLEVCQQGPLAVAYPYVEAQPLSTLLSSARARELLFPVSVSLRLIIDLLRGLQAVHESWLGWPSEVPFGGLLPASVLVSREGRTYLCDALVASSALLQRGFDLSAAELAYRAPEQVYASSAPEPSTDVFIAAILLWELLSGRRLLSGSKEVIERKLMEHDLPRLTADVRADVRLSRGLLELLDYSLALDPSQRPPTPGSLATALERCGHVVASRAEVAAFVNELAGAQLDRVATILRVALGYATSVEDDTQLMATVPWELTDEETQTAIAQPNLAAAPAGGAAAVTEARERAVAPAIDLQIDPRVDARIAPALDPSVVPAVVPAAGQPAAVALPSAATSRSLADSVARALERRRTSGEFPAFAPEAGPAMSRPAALGSEAALPPPSRSGVVPKGAVGAKSARTSAELPLAALPLVPSVRPSPWLRRGGPPDESSADEEKTTVHRAVRADVGVHASMAPPAPVRLAPKRVLLAAMATVVLLLQFWVFTLARSHSERSRSAAPDEPELSSEQGPGAAPPRPPERAETKPRSRQKAKAEPLRASER